MSDRKNNVYSLNGGNALTRTLPANPDVERALLGAILMNNSAYEKSSDFLMPEHFAEAVNGRLYATVATLINRNEAANPVTLKGYLQNDDLVNAAGGFLYIAGLAKAMVTARNSGEYGRLIYDLHRRRMAISMAEDLMNAAYDAPADVAVETMLESSISELIDLNEPVGVRAASNVGSAVDAVLAQHQAIDNGEVSGTSSGFPSIDLQCGLMQDADLIILGGRPGQGKSALASGIGIEAARIFQARAEVEKTKPKHVLIMSGEMSEQQWVSRILTGATGIPGPRQRTGHERLTQQEWDKLAGAQGDLASLPMIIDDGAAPTLSRILARSRELRRQGGVGLIIVDYLQLMGIEKSRRQDNRSAEIGFLARGLKNLAKLLECPVIALSQITRGVETRENKRPTMADLRESGDIEAAADSVYLLYREAYYLLKAKPEKSDELLAWNTKLARVLNQAEVIVDKARHGATGTVFLNFDGPLTKFTDPTQKPGYQPEMGLE